MLPAVMLQQPAVAVLCRDNTALELAVHVVLLTPQNAKVKPSGMPAVLLSSANTPVPLVVMAVPVAEILAKVPEFLVKTYPAVVWA